ncbi:polysaccharide biosynthesis tyrosine autokinase [candidate division KSB1 bacterium]|nr:polysaccharide biosynthesis tyrosine autokinase [candidate division KSB1 bacterium]
MMEELNYTQAPPPPPAFDEEPESQFDFGKYLRGLLKRIWLVGILTVVFALFFYYRTKQEIPIYQTQAFLKTVEFDDSEGQILSRERQVEMRTRNFKEQVAARLGLALKIDQSTVGTHHEDIFQDFSTDKDPVVGEYRLTTSEDGAYRLYTTRGDGQTTLLDSALVWDVIEDYRTVNGFSFQLNPQFVAKDAEILFRIRDFSKALWQISKVQVDISSTGSTMRLTLQGTDPTTLADELNRIARAYVEEALQLKSRDQSSHMKNLQRRLASAKSNLERAEEEMRLFNTRYPLSLEFEKESVTERLLAVERQLELLPRKRTNLKTLLEKLDEKPEGTNPVQFRRYIVTQLANFEDMANEPNLAILRETLKDQLNQYDDLLDRYSEDYEPVAELATKIEDTQDEIVSFSSKHLNTLTRQESDLKDEKQRLESKLRTFPSEESKLNELQKRLDIAEQIYNQVLAEIDTRSVEESVASGNIVIQDPALPPRAAINADKSGKIIMGAALGFFLGVAISVLIDITDRKIRTLDEMQKIFELDIIGTIPIVDFKDIPEYHDYEKVKQIDRQLVTHDYSPTPIGESYRALRTQLLFSKKSKAIQTLVLTSVGPEEGKSFTASNLAIIMGQQRSNTLLVDADLRRGVLHNTFGIKKSPGFTNYLSGNATLSSVVQTTHIPNLSVISCGQMLPNPSELLGSFQMKRFLEEARRKFDFIIFDTPPLEAATDAVVLGTQVDAVAIVARSGMTNKHQAEEKIKVFRQVPVNLVGVVVNGTDSTLVQDQYSYYQY